jgi:hypothetical protein
VDAGIRVILKDKLENTEFDLSNGSAYNFSADATATADRFVIAFRAPVNTTGLENVNLNNIVVYKNANNEIVVKVNELMKTAFTAEVYNAMGQKIISRNFSENNFVINNNLSAGVYFVSIKANGLVINKKVFLN